jgi:translation initiation factor 2 subunit 1
MNRTLRLIDDLKITKKLKDVLKKTVEEKIKSPEVEVKEIMKITSEKSEGIDIIKNILTKLQKGDIKINYIGSPKYKISVKASDYKTAEGVLEQLNQDAEQMAEEKGATVSFSRLK